MRLVEKECPSSVSIRAACDSLALSRAGYYRRQAPVVSPRASLPRPVAANALSEAERQAVLGLLNSERFYDQPPAEIYASLLDEGKYYCSISTMYRILRANQQTGERRAQKPAKSHAIPRLRATRPNDVWTWDITKLPTTEQGNFLNLYVVMDLYSRFIVAWMVSRKENSELSKLLISDAAARYRVALSGLTLHQDRGVPMTARGYLDLMAELGITCSHSRPRVSNDNPFSESQFKTLKQQPDYPQRLTGVDHARIWFSDYVDWYCFHHHHRGIAWFTPEQVFTGRYKEVSEQREQALKQAYQQHPKRFIHGEPKVKQPPTEVWINPALPEEGVGSLEVNYPTLNRAKER
ncbi:IS3 family transposase [Ectothiorhodospiraceae bacterium BW-2]|nr:IS3 family transposase [Ectothiorhodospiraceae bacterium BW-2]QEP42141.1 IS3 family transposase [Ectothiorhodospiraceae bacterium BW-2]QEP42639.1 IS3 family transposase [Ectothiorhodospiraceae bacterium BW-2]QEP43012.1 IS3 family transposase [Ectothiorhodospiraceae bacterium BW-2]QEP43256.1 IS3 family transposase [Ectothiorhodospiraceae bacterium BW-2]